MVDIMGNSCNNVTNLLQKHFGSFVTDGMVANKKEKESRNFPNKEVSYYHEFQKNSNRNCSWICIMSNVELTL